MTQKLTLLAVICFVSFDICLCSQPTYCDKISSHDKNEAKLGQIFKGLSELKLAKEVKNGTNPTIQYKIGVCGNASSTDPLAGVVRESQNKTTVLGRVNNSEPILGDSWLILMLGDGDTNVTNCSESHSATILFLCNNTLKGELHLVKELMGKTNSCSCVMEVETSIVCLVKASVEESVGHSFLLFTIILGIILAYFLGGALYRRFALGAKGLEQIPHVAFWSQLVENCRMFCCRRRRSSSSLWHGNEAGDDDSLLQP